MIHFTSDLHYGYGPAGDKATRALAGALERQERRDVLILAGDIATGDAQLRKCLALFDGFPGYKLALPGNHDVWTETGDSNERRGRVTAIFKEAGFHPLAEEPLVVNGIGFAGCMGWYDYSFRDESLGISVAAYRAKRYPKDLRHVWADVDYVHWGRGDEEVTIEEAHALGSQLARLTRDGVREIVVATHFLPTSRLLFHPRKLVPELWRFMNVYLGSTRFEEVVRRYPRVRLAVCGHSHTARLARIGATTYLSIGGGYEGKELVTSDGQRITRQAFS
ncbi:metallophosphoesterase [Candidatus Uhrbacteria bacterium]|nr:metallophosphoesterase [Candidatus Uhrbacteria bacterium]